MNRKNFYYIFSIIATLSWTYILFQISKGRSGPVFCPIKSVTTLPCPSCGSTRSILEIMHGNYLDALLVNPLGYISLLGVIITPIWIIYDLISKKETLYLSFRKTENYLKKRYIAIPLIVLIVANWLWNINKNL